VAKATTHKHSRVFAQTLQPLAFGPPPGDAIYETAHGF